MCIRATLLTDEVMHVQVFGEKCCEFEITNEQGSENSKFLDDCLNFQLVTQYEGAC